jgi:glycosyltransferase involved in cell wall biosynthesis
MTVSATTQESTGRRTRATQAIRGTPTATGLRVLHVISGRFFGGGQRVMLELMRALPRVAAVESRLCLLGEGETPLADTDHESVPYDGRYNRPATLCRAVRGVRRVLRTSGADVLHTIGTDADLIGALSVGGSRIPHVCHLQITPPKTRESWRVRARRGMFRAAVARRRTHFIACSDAVRQEMSAYYRLPGRRVHVVHNGIDPSRYQAASCARALDDGALVGTAARLAPMKGLEHLLAAVAELHVRGFPVRARIAGTGGLRDELERLAGRLGLAGAVEFAGFVEDMPAFYRGIDVFVLPSVSTEGLPLSLLEALAARRPVVATDLAGAAEAVRDEVDGLLVRPGDPRALAAAIERMVRDPELRTRTVDSGHRRVCELFTLDRMAHGVARICAALAADSADDGSRVTDWTTPE